jgi:hypothetical protein
VNLRIPQRTRIYLGCEGESEQSYGKRLGQIADECGLHLFLDCDVLQPGGGSPIALIELAVTRIKAKVKTRGQFAHKALLLDRDKLHLDPDWRAQIGAIAARYGLFLIWQRPCHESFLLRHFAEQTAMRPQNSELAMQALLRVWPEYRKALPASELATRIDLAAILRAASVEEDYRSFLALIGFHGS